MVDADPLVRQALSYRPFRVLANWHDISVGTLVGAVRKAGATHERNELRKKETFSTEGYEAM
jgi:hypothetical protein